MERDAVRLECLKLAVTRTTDQTEILARAEEYYGFVNKPEEQKAERVGGNNSKGSPKHVGNTKHLT